MPIPITTAPWIWLRPASGLIIRPASRTVTTRVNRSRGIFGCHRAARERAGRKRSIAECDLDLGERHAGLLRGELREDRVRAGADVLRGTCDAGCAVIAELYARLGGESCGDPRAPGHSPAQRQAVALH